MISFHFQLSLVLHLSQMSFFTRIGTTRYKFKLEFFINKVTFSKRIEGKMYISIKRGDHKKTTEQQVEMNQKNQFRFEKEVLTFDSITLFCDDKDHVYQEKPGEIKFIVKVKNGEKKLLGTLKFDVAAYANQKKQTWKEKKTIEETPDKLEGTFDYQVFLKFIGQASQTNKSVQNDKKKERNQSPLDKISNFFSGIFSSADNQKASEKVISPKKKEATPPKSSQKSQYKKNEEKMKSKAKAKGNSDVQDELEENIVEEKKKKKGYNFEQQRDTERNRRKKKQKKQNQEMQDENVNNQDHEGERKEKEKEKKKKKKEKYNEEENELEDNAIKKDLQMEEGNCEENVELDKKQKESKGERRERKEKVRNKNLIEAQERDNFTQYNSEVIQPIQKVHSTHKKEQPKQFYFDDPSSFNPNIQSSTDLPSKPQPNSEKLTPKALPQTKTESPLQKDVHAKKSSKNDKNREASQIQDENSQVSEERQSGNSDQEDEIFPKRYDKIEKNNPKLDQYFGRVNNLMTEDKNNKEQILQVKSKEQESKKKELPQKTISSKNEIETKVNQHSQELLQKIEQQQIYIEELKHSITDLEIKNKNNITFQKENEIKAQQTINKWQQKDQEQKSTIEALTKQNAQLKEEVKKKKSEGSRNTKEERETLNKSNLNPSQAEDKLRALEKQKNQQILLNQKEKEKYKKVFNTYQQEMEKEKAKYKELDETSRVELKKLKDECSKYRDTIESLTIKLTEKTKESDIVLTQSKQLNENIIILTEKLAAIKMKICEKLNEANSTGETFLIEVLTELNQDV